ncbi:LamG-like jellyroll fold domain-containing protein [Tenacibaculum sp. MEBiC06402]|uniref:LamG-like jellyroll fold domain-containing protein n=1 Tax=unclassified Tenacibaculum TaxID=2635139 RepID=UPI003B98FDC4
MKLKLHFILLLLFSVTSIHAQFPVTSGLVASYEFNNNLNDGVGNSNGTSGTGSPSFTTDRFGNVNASLFLNKTPHQFYTFSGLNNTMSISFWASFSATSSSTERILQIYDTTHGGGFRLEYNRPNAALNFIAKTANTGDFTSGTTLNTTTSGVWHHFVVTIEVNNGTVEGKVYIDGNLDSNLTINFAANGDLINNTAPLFVSPFGGSTNPSAYSGYVDDLYVYNRVLNSTEVNSINTYSPSPKIKYVDLNATGNNDGTSWANAFLSIDEALTNNFNPGDEIWIAKGTYYVSPLPSINSFFIDKDNVKIYGGFAGNEVSITDRDPDLIHSTNQTILSGDKNNNDNGIVSFGNSSRTDNSDHVVVVSGSGVTLDGLTIADGNADGLTGDSRYGAGIYLFGNANVLTVENCILKDNVAYWGAGMLINPPFNSNIKINACVFENNLGVLTGAFYAIPASGTTMNLRITNSLFNGNRTEDDNVTDSGNLRRGLGAPAGWIRAFNANSAVNSIIVNNTFVNNVAGGSGNSDFTVMGISKSNSNTGTSNNTIANNIFWNNTIFNGTVSRALGRVVDQLNVSITQVFNNIDEQGLTNVGGIGSNNNSNTNPNLTADFKLQASSTAAIDAGDNNAIPTGITLDLAGNNRIENSIVDIGAFEFSSTTLSVSDLDIVNFKMYPNPASNILTIKTDNEIDQVVIFSVLGKKAMTIKNTNIIDVSNLNKGIYLVRITTKDNKRINRKLIKN